MGQKKNLLISSAKSNFYFINPTELYCTNFLIEVTFQKCRKLFNGNQPFAYIQDYSRSKRFLHAIRLQGSDFQGQSEIVDLNLSREQPYYKYNKCYLTLRKVRCIFPMVVVSILLHAEFGLNDHRESVPHFRILLLLDFLTFFLFGFKDSFRRRYNNFTKKKNIFDWFRIFKS